MRKIIMTSVCHENGNSMPRPVEIEKCYERMEKAAKKLGIEEPEYWVAYLSPEQSSLTSSYLGKCSVGLIRVNDDHSPVEKLIIEVDEVFYVEGDDEFDACARTLADMENFTYLG